MNSTEAKQILKDNFECKENSLIYLLHEKNMFSTEQFWKYYDSISVLAETDEEKSMNTAMQITNSYQDILKYFIFHLDSHDGYKIANFPQNYSDYMDRIEYAIWAYFKGNVKWIDEAMFELQRQPRNSQDT